MSQVLWIFYPMVVLSALFGCFCLLAPPVVSALGYGIPEYTAGFLLLGAGCGLLLIVLLTAVPPTRDASKRLMRYAFRGGLVGIVLALIPYLNVAIYTWVYVLVLGGRIGVSVY